MQGGAEQGSAVGDDMSDVPGAECKVCGALFPLAIHGDYERVGAAALAHFGARHPELGRHRTVGCQRCGRTFADGPDASAVQHAVRHRMQHPEEFA